MEGRRSLGRGLLDLLAGADTSGTVTKLPLDQIRPNPYQPRRAFPPASLEALAASIREHGLLQPLVVAPDPGGGYVLIAGERRLRAAQMAGLETVPCVVRHVEDPARLALFALVENLQREDLNPIEEAEGYARLQAEYGLTQEAIARAVGKSRARVANLLRLLQLPEAIRTMVAEGRLGAGHAIALLGLDDAAAIEALARQAVARGMTVREIEAVVRRQRVRDGGEEPTAAAPRAGEPTGDDGAADLAARIQAAAQATGVRARLSRHAKGWRLVIEAPAQERLEPWIPAGVRPATDPPHRPASPPQAC